MLALRVGDARRSLGLDAPVGSARAGEIARFAAGAVAAVAAFALAAAPLVAGIALLVGWLRA